MIYTCENCGAWLPAKVLEEALKSKESTVMIKCPYCAAANVFNQSKRSPYVDQGFDYLCNAKFSDAHHAFSSSLHEADLGHRQVVSEAYLGLALAAHEIQVEFFDTDTEMRMNLICHNYKDTSFADSDNFNLALATIDNELRGKEREDKKSRFQVYADIVDGIRRRCGWIAPISVYPGEMEQQAMAYSVLKVLHGEAEAIHYPGKPVWEGFPFIDD